MKIEILKRLVDIVEVEEWQKEEYGIVKIRDSWDVDEGVRIWISFKQTAARETSLEDINETDRKAYADMLDLSGLPLSVFPSIVHGPSQPVGLGDSPPSGPRQADRCPFNMLRPCPQQRGDLCTPLGNPRCPFSLSFQQPEQGQAHWLRLLPLTRLPPTRSCTYGRRV